MMTVTTVCIFPNQRSPQIINDVRRLIARTDPFLLGLLAMVGLATILPARGVAAIGVDHATTIAIGALFFLYGARLSTRAALEGMRHWRLHLTVFAATFVMFPLLGLAAGLLLDNPLYAGVLYLCLLPSTVQSSIAFTSIARGNIPAAICSASFSNLAGVLVTPLLVAVLMNTHGGVSAGAIRDIALQLLAPFVAGQILRRWIGDWVLRHKKILGLVDRGSILLVVYAAFSEGVVAGIWNQVTPAALAGLLAINVVLLAIALLVTNFAARRLGFSTEDRITIVFCGSKKSLATGLPMAKVLFAGQSVGLIVLPLMLFHQIQLMACAVLAQRFAARTDEPATT